MSGDRTQVPFSVDRFADDLTSLSRRPDSWGYHHFPNFATEINEAHITFSCFCFKLWPTMKTMGDWPLEHILNVLSDPKNDIYRVMGNFQIDRKAGTMSVAPITQDQPNVATRNFLEEIELDRSDYLLMLNPFFFMEEVQDRLRSVSPQNDPGAKGMYGQYVEEHRDQIIHIMDVRNDDMVLWEDFALAETLEAM